MAENVTSLPKSAEIVILGAGVMGASIAFQLARRGAKDVLVLDKDFAGNGGSGRSSALVRMHYSFPPEVQLALVSLDLFQNWSELVGERGDFRKTGFVRIVHPEEHDLLKKNVEMQQKLGVKVSLVSRQQLQQLAPEWNVDEVELAAYEPDSGFGDGSNVTNDFLTAARARGVSYVPKTTASGFQIRNGRICGVATDKGEVSASVSRGRHRPVEQGVVRRLAVQAAPRNGIPRGRHPFECAGYARWRLRVH